MSLNFITMVEGVGVGIEVISQDSKVAKLDLTEQQEGSRQLSQIARQPRTGSGRSEERAERAVPSCRPLKDFHSAATVLEFASHS
jgi:hypothetical protein